MTDGAAILGLILLWIVGAVIGLVAGYWVIRLAVTHAIVSARSLPRRAASTETPTTPQAGRPAVWWEGEPKG